MAPPPTAVHRQNRHRRFSFSLKSLSILFFSALFLGRHRISASAPSRNPITATVARGSSSACRHQRSSGGVSLLTVVAGFVRNSTGSGSGSGSGLTIEHNQERGGVFGYVF
ncbi:hypothetical protein Hanom_Chr04g00327061 [Helianthus anomalus]